MIIENGVSSDLEILDGKMGGSFLRDDGSRPLTADWDIGAGRTIQCDAIASRSATGLSLKYSTTKRIEMDSTGIGFFNTTPAAQQTKAGHNDWAAISDVVDALVTLGLFDQA